jgi:hypothetical protein
MVICRDLETGRYFVDRGKWKSEDTMWVRVVTWVVRDILYAFPECLDLFDVFMRKKTKSAGFGTYVIIISLLPLAVEGPGRIDAITGEMEQKNKSARLFA